MNSFDGAVKSAGFCMLTMHFSTLTIFYSNEKVYWNEVKHSHDIAAIIDIKSHILTFIQFLLHTLHFILRSFSFIGRHRTITFTFSAILMPFTWLSSNQKIVPFFLFNLICCNYLYGFALLVSCSNYNRTIRMLIIIWRFYKLDDALTPSAENFSNLKSKHRFRFIYLCHGQTFQHFTHETKTNSDKLLCEWLGTFSTTCITMYNMYNCSVVTNAPREFAQINGVHFEITFYCYELYVITLIDYTALCHA